MGTRSITTITSTSSAAIICSMYRQFDGSPDDHGRDLLAVLRGLTDGHRRDPEDLATRMLVWFATGQFLHPETLGGSIRSGFYLTPGTLRRPLGIEYLYVVNVGVALDIVVIEAGQEAPIFKGNLDEFEIFVRSM